MIDAAADCARLPLLPVPREEEFPFDPPPEYARLRAEEPVVRVLCPTGMTAWLVTRYADAREVLGDGRRFTSRPTPMAHMLAAFRADAPLKQQFSRLDGPEHIRLRRSLAPQLSHPQRLAELRPFIEETVDQAIDRIAAATPPVDLHTFFSHWVTNAVIAELIGVPPEHRQLVQDAATTLFAFGSGPEDAPRALGPLYRYLYEQVRRRRQEPSDDVLSRMIQSSADDERPLTDDELVGMNTALLVAGFDTTASLLSHGVVALLHRSGEWSRLCAEPDLADTAAEEIVRYLGVSVGLLRQSTEDTELGGKRIAAGDYVVVAVQSANRDPDLHVDADQFDIGRRTGPHVGFGHGAHACVGRQIARMELSSMLRALPGRIPSLRLARPLEEIPFRTETVVRGPAEVLVTWDEVLPRATSAMPAEA